MTSWNCWRLKAYAEEALLATGKDKAEAVYKMMKEPVTPHVPASVLQLHPDCIILVDEAAASLMK